MGKSRRRHRALVQNHLVDVDEESPCIGAQLKEPPIFCILVATKGIHTYREMAMLINQVAIIVV